MQHGINWKNWRQMYSFRFVIKTKIMFPCPLQGKRCSSWRKAHWIVLVWSFQLKTLTGNQEARAELDKQLKQTQNSLTDTTAQLGKVCCALCFNDNQIFTPSWNLCFRTATHKCEETSRFPSGFLVVQNWNAHEHWLCQLYCAAAGKAGQWRGVFEGAARKHQARLPTEAGASAVAGQCQCSAGIAAETRNEFGTDWRPLHTGHAKKRENAASGQDRFRICLVWQVSAFPFCFSAA